MRHAKPIPEKPDENARRYLKALEGLAQKKREEDLDAFEAAIRAKAVRLMRRARAGLG